MGFPKGKSGNPGGRPPETIECREVRRLAQAKTHAAYAVIESLMVGAEKDSVRLAAALAVLRIAGMNLAGDVTVNVHPPTPAVPPETLPVEALEGDLGPAGTIQ